MNKIRTSILGIAAAIGIAAVSLFSPVSVQPQAEAAIIINTCTSTYQLVGKTSVLSGSDSVLVNVTPSETPPVTWVASVALNVTVTDTQIIFTFSADTEVLGYYLVKIDSSGNTISTSGIITSDTYAEDITASDTYYYYTVKALSLAGNTGTLSESVAVGVSSEGGLVFSPTISNSTVIEVVCRDDDRVSVRIPQPKAAFGTEQDMMKLVVKKITRESLPVPKWAKNSGIATAYEVYCRKLSGASITTFSAPVELTFAYDLVRDKVDGTSLKTAEILSRLAIFRWNGSTWTRFASTIDLLRSTVWSQTYQLSHFVVGDVRALSEPGFAGLGAQPNPFTPNSDGINDVAFFKFTNDNDEEGMLTIFDLNGAVIYTESIPKGAKHAFWDGKCNFGRTDLAEAGAYIWQAKIGSNVYNGIVVIAK